MPTLPTLKESVQAKLSAWSAKFWPAAASAFMLGVTHPPTHYYLLVFAALAPWLWSLKRLSKKDAKGSGWVFGLIYFGFNMGWLQIFVQRWTGSFLLGFAPFVLSVLIQVSYAILFASLASAAYRANRAWVVPFAWAAVEVFRSTIPWLAFPHGLLAIPLWVQPELIQLSAIFTIYGVGAWIVLANVLMVEFYDSAPKSRVMAMGSIWTLLAVFSFVRSYQARPGTTKVITIGQVGFDQAFGEKDLEPEHTKDAVEALFAQTALQQPDLLVLCEGLTFGGSRLPPATPFQLPPPVPTIFGGQRMDEKGQMHQSCYAYDPQTGWAFADKTRLVIFGEIVPMRDLPFMQGFKLPAGNLVPGEKTIALDINGIRVGPIICFEGVFDEVALHQAGNGAQLLAVQSIDDWYMDTSLPEELFGASAFRAAENGLPLVRAASLGISGAFDARGHLMARPIPIKERFAQRLEIPLPERGDGFQFRWLFGWIAGAIAVSSWFAKSKPAPDSAPPSA